MATNDEREIWADVRKPAETRRGQAQANQGLARSPQQLKPIVSEEVINGPM
jgi:hypothetical protein